MRTVHLLILICFVTACQTERDELVGHWHSISSAEIDYHTLDITDSTTQVNKYGGEWYPEFLRYHEDTGGEALVFDFKEYKDYKLINDTLVIHDQLKFLKVEEKHHLNDRFPNSKVRLNLPKPTNNPTIELPQWKSRLSDIYIGPSIQISESDELINADGTSFQTWDFLATDIEDLKIFAQGEKDKLHKDMDYWLVIHADSTTSQTTIDSLRTLLEPLGVINDFIVSRYNYELDQLVYEELDSR